MSKITAIRAGTPVDMDKLETALPEAAGIAQQPDPRQESAEVAATIFEGVNVADAVKNNLDAMVEKAAAHFEELRKEVLEFTAEVQQRQAKIEERISRFTEDCVMLKAGVGDVFKKLGERAQ